MQFQHLPGQPVAIRRFFFVDILYFAAEFRKLQTQRVKCGFKQAFAAVGKLLLFILKDFIGDIFELFAQVQFCVLQEFELLGKIFPLLFETGFRLGQLIPCGVRVLLATFGSAVPRVTSSGERYAIVPSSAAPVAVIAHHRATMATGTRSGWILPAA